MILELGINRFAKQVSSPDFKDGLKSLKELANQAGAEDKYGSMSASIQIILIAITISGLLYYVSLSIFPNNLKNYLKTQNKKYNQSRENYQKEDTPEPEDFLDTIFSIAKRAGLLGGAAGGSIYYYKKRRKAARQRAMQLAMQEEMDRLKAQLEEELTETSSATGVVNNKSSILSGANIVELFNSFADIMAIQNDLPREEDETALEYFEKVAESINFPKSESLKAAVYFDDELYGKKNSTKEDKAAFMKLILEMISKINKSSGAAANKNKR